MFMRYVILPHFHPFSESRFQLRSQEAECMILCPSYCERQSVDWKSGRIEARGGGKHSCPSSAVVVSLRRALFWLVYFFEELTLNWSYIIEVAGTSPGTLSMTNGYPRRTGEMRSADFAGEEPRDIRSLVSMTYVADHGNGIGRC
jgi:hypothetical protein